MKPLAALIVLAASPLHAGANTRYYEVHEYMAGARRPFLAIGEGFASTGFCE